ncbi:hypothetical protein BO79DRAFT_281136, partial [Aspergillus costaricaensis CBS 115574]
PGEIVLILSTFLPQHDLAQFVLVCKYWYKLLISHLYRHVKLPLHDYCGSEYDPIRCNRDLPIRRFTTFILNKLTFAPFIRSLELYARNCEVEWYHQGPLEPVDEQKCRSFMLPYGDANSEHRRKFQEWRRDLKHSSERQDSHRPYRYEDAWLALLMVQLNNLEEFAIELAEEWDHLVGGQVDRLKNSVHFERVLEWARNPELGILTRLERVSLANGPAFWQQGTAMNAVSFNRVMPYLKIPSLRRISVKKACDRTEFSMPRDLIFPLTHLDLLVPNDGVPHLPSLLKRCPQLQSLTLELGDWGENETHGYLDYSALHLPLQRSQYSLRHLSLTFEGHGTCQEANIPAPAFFGSLVKFCNLQSIHMRWSNLMSFSEVGLVYGVHEPTISLRDVLPRSLQHLWIDDCLIQCSLPLCREIECLLIDSSETFVQLKTIYLRYAAKEQVSEEICIRGVGGHGSDWRVMKADPIIGGRLLDLQDNFRALDVDFWVIPTRDTAVSFPPNDAIEKNRPEGISGRILEYTFLLGLLVQGPWLTVSGSPTNESFVKEIICEVRSEYMTDGKDRGSSTESKVCISRALLLFGAVT